MRPLGFERLEDRNLCYVLAPFGGFDDPDVTVSFPPAGTVFSKNVTVAVSPMWRDCVLEALEKWDEVSGLDITEVADDGTPHGMVRNQDGKTFAKPQGDARFGDIRAAEIAERVLSSSLDLPWYSWMPSDSWSGGGDSMVDRRHAKLAPHIADHHGMDHFSLFITGKMLGLNISKNRDAVMHTAFANPSSPHELTADDIAGIQALYGPPEPAPTAAVFAEYANRPILFPRN